MGRSCGGHPGALQAFGALAAGLLSPVSRCIASIATLHHLPMEQIAMNYSKIEIEYKEQKADGTLGGTVKAGWDVKANKKV